MKKKRWLTLFPDSENIHLTKDVGMIPYILFKKYDYDSTIVSYKNGQYPYLQTEVAGLKQIFLAKVTGNSTLDCLIFLLLNFRKYDILQVYHITTQSLVLCYFFTIIKLGKGKTYLKLDAKSDIKKLNFTFLKQKFIDHILNSISLISVETKDLYKYLQNNWKSNVKYIPNGFYDNDDRTKINFDEKENLIITVGRIGTYQKNSEVLCEAFEKFARVNNTWRLEVIGPVEDEFYAYIDLFFSKNPQLRSRVNFRGPVTDRIELYNFYKQAKIFVLTSRWEGFPLVYLESLRFGCYIISSDVDAASDITNNGISGFIFPIGNSEKLSEILLHTINNSKALSDGFEDSSRFAYDNFYWPRLCGQIDNYLYQ